MRNNIDLNVLPQSLRHLTFGLYFIGIIEENVLPESLTHLTFGNSSYKGITFGNSLYKGINRLPKSLI